MHYNNRVTTSNSNIKLKSRTENIHTNSQKRERVLTFESVNVKWKPCVDVTVGSNESISCIDKMSIWRDSASTRIADGKMESPMTAAILCDVTEWLPCYLMLQEPAAPVSGSGSFICACSVICTRTRHIFRQIFPFVMSWLSAVCKMPEKILGNRHNQSWQVW